MALTETLCEEVEAPNPPQWTAAIMREWSRTCGKFLAWERQNILLVEPSQKERAEHREALTWMLRLTKLYHFTASDPQFPEKDMEKELRGRLVQLEHSWAALCDQSMTEVEADRLLAEVFPDEPGTGTAP